MIEFLALLADHLRGQFTCHWSIVTGVWVHPGLGEQFSTNGRLDFTIDTEGRHRVVNSSEGKYVR